MTKSLPLSGACKKYEEDLVLYYYGESSAVDRRQVDGHLSECGACRRFVNDLRGVLPQLAKSQEMPESFWQNYYRETVAKLDAQEARRDWWSSLCAPWKTWLVPAFGTAAVAVFAVGLLLAQGSLPLSINESPAKLPAEIIGDTNQLDFFSSLEMLESLSRLEPSENGGGRTNPDQSSQLRRERAVA